MSLPENHVAAEGRTLRAAIEAAANQLGVSPNAVAHKLDLAHFRTAGGSSSGAETVRIFAWTKDAAAIEADARAAEARAVEARSYARDDQPRDDEAPRREELRDGDGSRRDDYRDRPSRRDDRGPRRDDRGPRRDEGGGDGYRAQEPAPRTPGVPSPASDAAAEWMRGLLAAMGREGSVAGEASGDEVFVAIDVKEGAGHLVGRHGSTLRAIQHLLELSVGRDFPDARFRLDVSRPDGDRRPPRDDDRRDRPPRDDRGPREGGFRDGGYRDRGPREGGRGFGGRDDRRERSYGGGRDFGGRDDRRPSRRDDEELKKLARKLALKVRETGEVETIRRELNSYDRRLVHLEVAEVGGVASRSIGEGTQRRVEIYVPDEGGEG